MDSESITKNGIARCVWEKRMKCDQVKGGIKLFKGTEEDEICNDLLVLPSNDDEKKITSLIEQQKIVVHDLDKNKKEDLKDLKEEVVVVVGTNGGKRKTWKSESPIQLLLLSKQRSETTDKNLEEKSSIDQNSRKTRSDESIRESKVVEKSPIDQNKKSTTSTRSAESIQLKKKKKKNNNPEILRKTKSESLENSPQKPQKAKSQHYYQENGESSCNEGIVGIKNCKEFVVGGEEKDNEAAEHKVSIVKKKTIHVPSPSKTNPSSDESQRIPRKHTKLQSFVDLVMWRDVSKSAFVFGIGAFSIISSSYTNDLNISFISVISYLSLVYLAAIFLFRSFISRGMSEMNNDSSMKYVFGEEEAVWLVKLTLPYVNECFLNLKALFSGDPATTIKMALMLFVLARCGSSLTIWKMAKLSFFGVFIVPKIWSSYSTQFTEYGIFWIGRFRDVWESCTHKKALAFAIFTLVWKLSSSIVRIWAVFMLFVAFQYYQQQSIYIGEGWAKEKPRFEDSAQTKREGPAQRQQRSPILLEMGKQR